MLDKVEPPQIPIGYGISIAYACLLDIIRSIALAINGLKDDNNENQIYQPSESEQKLHVQLLNSSWCGLLAALSPLIDARLIDASSHKLLLYVIDKKYGVNTNVSVNLQHGRIGNRKCFKSNSNFRVSLRSIRFASAT